MVDVLDARDPACHARFAAWLALQRHFALRPERLPPEAREARALAAPAAVAAVAPLARAEAARLLEGLARQGVRGVPIASPAYPERLRRLADAPVLLLARGTPALLLVRAVAIVGARAPTEAGRATARRLAFELARAGLAIVSGLARGIDAAAHEGALAAGGATLAFQACGPERVYPAAHRGLAERVAAQGALLTEFPPGTPPLAAYFPLRNRLISALGEALVVVEARERSGSLVSARCAADQGVTVLAVPGPIDAPTSRGTNRLIQDGARLVLESADVLRELGLAPPAAPPAPAPEARGLPGAVVRALRRQPLSRDELAAALGRTAAELAPALLALELDGRLREDRDGRLRVLRPPPL
jgi:DNA processing protein